MKTTRVLIVDDEPGIRESLTGVLEDEGYFCASVESGEKCLEELARANYEVVLLDVWLDGMDGLETLSRIQEIPFADRPEVVIISGHGTIETAVKATKMGAFDFLEAPLTIDKVTLVLNMPAAAPAGTGTAPAERIRGRQAAHHRRERAHEGAAPAAQPDGAHQWPRVDFRRERHRQGTSSRARFTPPARARRGEPLSK